MNMIITDDLAIGTSEYIDCFQRDGWKALCVRDDVCAGDRHFPLIDGGGNDPDTIRAAIEIVLEWWDGGGRVFVCCRQGRNRSALVAAAALAIRHGFWLGDGLKVLMAKRPIVSPRDDTMAEVIAALRAMRQDGW